MKRIELSNTVVTATVLAEYLAVTQRSLVEIAKACDFPKVGHGTYDLKVCVPLYIKHIKKRHEKMKAVTDASLTDQRARLTKAKADEAELKLLERSGALIPVDVIEAAWTDAGSMIKQRLLSIPSKLAPRLLTMKKAPDIQRAIDREISEVLNELAKVKVYATEDSDGDPDQD